MRKVFLAITLTLIALPVFANSAEQDKVPQPTIDSCITIERTFPITLQGNPTTVIQTVIKASTLVDSVGVHGTVWVTAGAGSAYLNSHPSSVNVNSRFQQPTYSVIFDEVDQIRYQPAFLAVPGVTPLIKPFTTGVLHFSYEVCQ